MQWREKARLPFSMNGHSIENMSRYDLLQQVKKYHDMLEFADREMMVLEAKVENMRWENSRLRSFAKG